MPITRRSARTGSARRSSRRGPSAGDLELGERFLADLAPFIWRKYFDYAAIADIHAMKRQIHAVRGHEQVVVPGHDIKLGRGGIREIEFFVQTQQLIFGGRRPQMRGSRTLDMLRAACTPTTGSAPRRSRISSRPISSCAGSSTGCRWSPTSRRSACRSSARRSPVSPNSAAMRGSTAFAKDLTRHLTRVEQSLRPAVRGRAGAQRRCRQSRLHRRRRRSRDACDLARARVPAIRRRRRKRFAAGISAAARRSAAPRAREVLTELTPALLEAFAGSGDPDAALAAFDEALARMPASRRAAVDPALERQRCANCSATCSARAPRLAQVIATRPACARRGDRPGARRRLRGEPRRATRCASGSRPSSPRRTTYEEALNRARDFAAEEMFLIGLNLLSGRLDPDRAGRAYSALAQGLIAVAARARSTNAFAAEHGRVRGGRVAVVGARQARLARDDRRLRSRSHPDLRFSRRRGRVGRPQAARSGGLLRAADAAADRGADRADQGGAPL